jgi:dCMP deaminase
MTASTTALILYIPVIHRKYVEIIREWGVKSELACLYIVGEEMIKGEGIRTLEIRALEAYTVANIIGSMRWLPIDKIGVLTPDQIPFIQQYCTKIATAREQMTMGIVGRCFPDMPTQYIDTFLRWDKSNVATTHPPEHHAVSTNPDHLHLMAIAEDLSEQSSDWWRQVGAVVADPLTLMPIVRGYNQHMPGELTPYIEGDPRDVIAAGTNPELATAIHAEGAAIAEAALRGVCTHGTYLFTLTFPCAACARLIVRAGIKKVFYRSGHANLDGDRLIRAAGIEIVHIPPVQ